MSQDIPCPDAQARVDAWVGIITSQATLMRVLEPRLKKGFDLTPPQYEILRRLVHAPDGRMRMKALAEVILYGSGAATNLVHRLVERGLVTRETVPGDGRGVWVKLTDAGRTLIDAARTDQKQLIVEMMPSFDDDAERDTVLAYLDRVVGYPIERVELAPPAREH